MNEFNSERIETEAARAILEAAQQLEALLAVTARRLRPFPAFLGMTSLQAVEVEPRFAIREDLGCVVVDPEGRLCSLELSAISGVAGIAEADQVDNLAPLDLDPTTTIIYAGSALELLLQELRRRGG